MLSTITGRIGDIRTLTRLLRGAEAAANDDGRELPDVEHLVLSACALPDGTARRALRTAGLEPDDVDTMLLIERGVPYAKSSAFLRAVRFFRFPMNLLSVGLIVPRFLRDWLYDRVAKNRYSLFGKKELCLIPAPEERARFLPG